MGLEPNAKQVLRDEFPEAFVSDEPPCTADTDHIMVFYDVGMLAYRKRANCTRDEFISGKINSVAQGFKVPRPEGVVVDVVLSTDWAKRVTLAKLQEHQRRKDEAERPRGPDRRRPSLVYPNRSAIPPRGTDEMEPEWTLLMSDRRARKRIIEWMLNEIIEGVDIPPNSTLVIDQEGFATGYNMHNQRPGRSSSFQEPMILRHFHELFGEADFAPIAFASRLRQLERSIRVAQRSENEIEAERVQFNDMNPDANLFVPHSDAYDETFDLLDGKPTGRLRVIIDSTDGDVIMMCAAATEALRAHNIEVIIRGITKSYPNGQKPTRDSPDYYTEIVLPAVLWDRALGKLGSRERVWSLFMLAFFEGCDLCPRPVYEIGAGCFMRTFIHDFDNRSLLGAPHKWLTSFPWGHQSLADFIPPIDMQAFEDLVVVTIHKKTAVKRRVSTVESAIRAGYSSTVGRYVDTAPRNGESLSKRASAVPSQQRLRNYFLHAYFALQYYCLYGWSGFALPRPEDYGWRLSDKCFEPTGERIYVTE
jgi:hypothetical protein